MNKRARNSIILAALLAMLAVFSVRLYNKWESVKPPPKFNVIVYTCEKCGKETIYPQTTFARPNCGYCGSNEGQIKREMRAMAETAPPPQKGS